MKKYYFMIVLFYTGLMALALMGRNGHGFGAEDVSEDSLELDTTQTVMLNIPLMIPEAPALAPAVQEEQGGTNGKKPIRYQPGGIVDESQTDLPAEYLLRSDRIEDFISRFNGSPKIVQQMKGKIDFTSGGTQPVRTGLIYSLLNEAYPQSVDVLKEFVETVMMDSLAVKDEDMAAVVTLAYQTEGGERFPVRLTLRKGMTDGAEVWFIQEAESPFFTYGDKLKPYYIDAAEPAVGFMGLGTYTTRSAESLTGQADFQGDGLAAYLLLASKGYIRYVHSEKTQYVFRTGQWQFLAEHIESFEHRRSGFLITRIAKDGRIVYENRLMHSSSL